MNLLDATWKAEARQAMKNVFDTFARSTALTFYKMANETVVVFDPEYNADFQEFEVNNNITQTSQSSAFTVRIWYLERQEFASFIAGGENLGVKAKQHYNRIRIQMEADAFAYLKDSLKFIILDEEYKISEDWQRVGILDEFQFYEVILQRIN